MKAKNYSSQSAIKRNTVKKEPALMPGSPKVLIALGIIILISFIAYLPVFHNNLLDWDDEGYIKNNLLVHTFNLKGIFSQYVMGNYHPITMLAFAIEYQLFGLNAAGYHAVNLFLHLMNTLLVFYALYLLTDKVAIALITSLLFGIHPLHVESVAWAAELKDLLYTLFFLAAYICYLKYLRKKNFESRTGDSQLRTEDRRQPITNITTSAHHHISTSSHQHILTSSHYYILALLFFLISLLSKAMAASLPLVLILTDYFKGRKINTKTLLEKAPFFLLALIFGVVAVFAQKSTASIWETIPFHQRIVFASFGFINYLLKLLFPLNLCAFYPYPLQHAEIFVPGHYYLYLAGVLVLAACVVYSRRFSKNIIFGMGFFTITILLVLQLLPVGKAIMADRYGYIPSIGIFYLAGEGLMYLWKKKQQLAVISLLCVFTMLFSAKTYARCGVWKNEKIFWSDVIDQYQTVEDAYYNRGIIYMHEKRNADAISDLNKAIEINPFFSNAYNNLGLVHMNEGKNDVALIYFNKAVEFKADNAEAYYNRGTLFSRVKRYAEAISNFDRAIGLKPDYSEAYNNRGSVFLNEKRNTEALNDFNKAIELNPGNAEAYFNRGSYFMNQKRNAEAINDFNKALALNPGYVKAFNNRGIVLVDEKRTAEAINDFTRIIELQPGNPEAYNNRGFILMNEKRIAEALNDFNQAIQLNPGFTGAYMNMANLLFDDKRFNEAVGVYSKVISLMNNYAPAFYKRGLAGFYAGDKAAACADLNHAAALGYRQAADVLPQICK